MPEPWQASQISFTASNSTFSIFDVELRIILSIFSFAMGCADLRSVASISNEL